MIIAGRSNFDRKYQGSAHSEFFKVLLLDAELLGESNGSESKFLLRRRDRAKVRKRRKKLNF